MPRHRARHNYDMYRDLLMSTHVQVRGRAPKEVLQTGQGVMSKAEFRALEDILMALGRGRAQDAAAQVHSVPCSLMQGLAPNASGLGYAGMVRVRRLVFRSQAASCICFVSASLN